MFKKVKIAAVQMDPVLMSKRENLDKVLNTSRITSDKGANLIVFPECALTGYVFASREEAVPYMETIPGPSTDEIAKCCRETGIYVIIGLLEIDGKRCFNSAILVGPEGLIGKHRKVHLPFLGVDRFLDQGDQPFQVYQTPVGNIGILICYDCNFPESARVVALMGADILAIPTNWPKGREKVPGLIVPTRAFENKVYVVAADRVGNERETVFIGLSRIIDTTGDILTEASGDKEEVIYAEVNPASARQKRTIIKSSNFEMDFIHDRRPELYGEILKKKNTPKYDVLNAEVENIMETLRELTIDLVNGKRNRKETVNELHKRIDSNTIYQMSDNLTLKAFITEVFVSLDNLIEEGFAPSLAEIKYFAECFEGKRTFSREEVRKFSIGAYEKQEVRHTE